MIVPHPQVLLNGLLVGGLYGFGAMGLQVILGAMGWVHLAYGHFVVLVPLLSAWGVSRTGLPPALAVPLAALGVGGLGWALHLPYLGRWLRSRDQGRGFFLVSLGLALVLEAAGGGLWSLPTTLLRWSPSPLHVGGLILPPLKMAVMGALGGAAVALSLFLSRNRWGRALRAWDSGQGSLWVVGVDPEASARRALGMGLGMAGLTGFFVAFLFMTSVHEAMGLTIRFLCLAVLAKGIQPKRVMGWGLLLGVMETWVSQTMGHRWGGASWYFLLPLVLFLSHIRRKP